MRARDAARAVAGLAALIAASSTPRPATAAETRVNYLAGGSVYVEAGRLEGLAEGDTLVVLRDGNRIAKLRVTFLSSHRASCDTLAVAVAPRIGDRVRYAARAPVRADSLEAAALPDPGATPGPVAVASDSAAARAAASHRPRPLRGRIGVRYLAVNNAGGAGDLSEPALDLRLEGTRLGGSPADIGVDLRSRRTSWTRAGGQTTTDSQARFYRATLSFHDPAGRRRITVGRQSASALSSVSLFDGALGEVGGERWSIGAFSGTQPRPGTLGLSSDIVEYGGFATLRQRPAAVLRWQLEGGGVTSYATGQPNRDFLFLQGFVQDRRFSASAIQEADVARGWKRGLGEPRIALTSTFLTARFQSTPALAWRAGFDNRRSVRLYRDRLTPESDFDDRYRTGAWAGGSFDLGPHVHLDGDLRARGGVPSERAHTWTGGAEARRLGSWNPRARVRVSRYRSAATLSDLFSLALSLDPREGIHVEYALGTRSTTDRIGDLEDQVRWSDVDLDLALARRWYLTGSYERDRGGAGDVSQGSAGLSWRF